MQQQRPLVSTVPTTLGLCLSQFISILRIISFIFLLYHKHYYFLKNIISYPKNIIAYPDFIIAYPDFIIAYQQFLSNNNSSQYIF